MTVPGPGPMPPQGRRAGYVQRGKDRTASRARNVIEPHLEPGEQPLAWTRLHTGPSDWWRLVPRVGELVRFFQRHYFVVHTDRRLIFCRLSYWTARPKNVKMTLANEHVRISSYRPGKLHPSLKLSHPDRKRPMTLRGNRVWRPEVEQMLAGFGYGANGQPVPAPAYQQPGAPPYQAPQGYQAPPV